MIEAVVIKPEMIAKSRAIKIRKAESIRKSIAYWRSKRV